TTITHPNSLVPGWASASTARYSPARTRSTHATRWTTPTTLHRRPVDNSASWASVHVSCRVGSVAVPGHPLPDVGSVDARVVAGDVDPRPVAGELVAVPDDVIVERHQGARDELVGVDGVGLRGHGVVVE